MKRYHDRGLHICVWINPYIGQKSCLFKEGKEHGYLVKKTDGSVWQTDLWQRVWHWLILRIRMLWHGIREVKDVAGYGRGLL